MQCTFCSLNKKPTFRLRDRGRFFVACFARRIVEGFPAAEAANQQITQ